jgi:arylsulfatase A-like enzyme
MKHFNRRDFLKLAGTLPLGYVTSHVVQSLGVPNLLYQDGQKNILIIVFDALSASNVSLYGYPRETMPNLSRLSKRGIVYRNHYANGNFTSPGTASLLTGVLPWTHRALEYKGRVANSFEDKNLFSAFDDYYRIAYTHNPLADTLLEQFKAHLEYWLPWKELFLNSSNANLMQVLKKDVDTASVAWSREMFINRDGYAYSLFLSHLVAAMESGRYDDLKKRFPRGLPTTGSIDNEFILETGIDWVEQQVRQVQRPSLGYFHFLPPHLPYNTPLEFYEHFKEDGYISPSKPEDVFSDHVSSETLSQMRREYDEYLLYVDSEFGRLFDGLENDGILDNTWVVFTSDHGEMFERGISGHSSDTLYQPVIRVPLIIFEPGRTEGLEVHTPTSAIDVLPTLLSIAGKNIPDWIEGSVMAPFENSEINDHDLFVVRANKNGKYEPLTRTSIVLIQGQYKLHYYLGYKERGQNEIIRLYDLDADPEELNDLAPIETDLAARMLADLKSRLDAANKPYIK